MKRRLAAALIGALIGASLADATPASATHHYVAPMSVCRHFHGVTETNAWVAEHSPNHWCLFLPNGRDHTTNMTCLMTLERWNDGVCQPNYTSDQPYT